VEKAQRRGRRGGWRGWLAVGVVAVLVPVTAGAWENAGIRDVPLNPWTGFAQNWDWTYDALHSLVLSGITGPVVLNMKPMSRREMALIVADVVQRVQVNHVMDFGHRGDLQDTLLALMREFSPELLALGVTGSGITGEAPRLLEVKPLEHLQFRGAYTSNAPTDLEYRNGERLDQGLNGRLTTSSWLEAGGVLAAYAQPEYRIGRDTNQGRLVEGYAKARGGPFELVAGREALWWGPAFHGSMLLSNNALGLDMVRIQTANQVTLPWLLRYLGPLKFAWFFAQLEAEREHPRTKLEGARLDLAPTSWLELGFGRVIMFDGDGRPKPSVWQSPALMFYTSDNNDSKYSGNTLLQADVTLRLADVGKYVPITRDAELYVDVGVDDTCCKTAFIPLKPGATVGLYLPNLFQSPDTTFRVEYSNTSSFNFTHSVYTDGYSRKGDVISHFEGTAGEDLFFRLTEQIDPKLQLGFEFDMARRGQTRAGTQFGTKELHRYVGVDLSYRHTQSLTLVLGTRLEWVRNRDFVAGNSDINQVYTLELTYTFDTLFGAGERRAAGRRQSRNAEYRTPNHE
jgi:hypothetical protein